MSQSLILVINPGSTSTKLAIYRGEEPLCKETIQHEIAQLGTLLVAQQLPFRMEALYRFLEKNGYRPEDFAMIACRGGQLSHVGGGSYWVNGYMMDQLTYAAYRQHASNLACLMGGTLTQQYGVPSIISDSPCTDELDEVARLTGVPGCEIIPGCHALNTKAVARKVAAGLGRRYEECNFIMVHLGGGVTLSAHKAGRIVDSISSDNGPMSPERAGRIPSTLLLNLAYSGEYTHEQLHKLLMGGSGVLLHLGTQDMVEVERRVRSGDEKAERVVRAMAYQVAKGIGEMAAVLMGQVDRIVFTGGLAHYTQLVDWIRERVQFISPSEVIPGEFEMEALAAAALRVLNGEEIPKIFDLPPANYDSVEAFLAEFSQVRAPEAGF